MKENEELTKQVESLLDDKHELQQQLDAAHSDAQASGADHSKRRDALEVVNTPTHSTVLFSFAYFVFVPNNGETSAEDLVCLLGRVR